MAETAIATPQKGAIMEPRIIIAASALAVAGVVLAALSATALGSAKAAAKWPAADQPALGVTTARIGLTMGVLLCAAAAGLGGSMARVDSLAAWLGVVISAVVLALGLTTWAALKLANKIELSSLINSPSPGAGEHQIATRTVQAQPAAPPPEPDPAIAYGEPYPGTVKAPMISVSPSSPVAPAESSEQSADAIHSTTRQTWGPTTRSGSDGEGDANVPHVLSGSGDRPDEDIPEGALPGWVYTDAEDNWYLVTATKEGKRLVRLTDFALMAPGTAEGVLRLAGSVEMTVWPAEGLEVADAEEDVSTAEDAESVTGEENALGHP